MIVTAFRQTPKQRENRIQSLQARIDADGTDAQAHLFLGNTLHSEVQSEAARAEWRKVIVLDNEPVYVQMAQETLDRYGDART